MLTDRNFGKHTAYSRYASQIVPSNPESWSYNIDDSLWPLIPNNNFRVMSLNCLRFPKTYYSLRVIANCILSAKPDIVLLQEIDCFAMARQLVQFINSYHGSFLYNIQEGVQSIRNLSLVVFYKVGTLSEPARKTLFSDLPDYRSFFPRLPLQIKLTHADFDVTVVNNHLVSMGYKDNVIMLEDSFEALGNYFDWSPTSELVLCGGDFNHDTTGRLYTDYLSQFQIVYGSYRNSSDIVLFHKDNYGHIVQSGFAQYFWDYKTILDITKKNWELYVSDHFPIVLDMPL